MRPVHRTSGSLHSVYFESKAKQEGAFRCGMPMVDSKSADQLHAVDF